MTEDYERGGISGGGDGRTAQSRRSTKLYMEEEKRTKNYGLMVIEGRCFCLFFERVQVSNGQRER